MPTVPRANPNALVPTAPLPSMRVNPSAPASAFMAPEPIDLAGPRKVFEQVFDEERRKADQTALLDGDTKLSQLRNKILYDPQKGVLSQKGQNVLPAAQGVSDQWMKGVSDIESGLTNDRQRMAFRRAAVDHVGQLELQVAEHISSELTQDHERSVFANVQQARNDALSNYQDAERVQSLIDKQRGALNDLADVGGYSPERRAQLIQSEVSQTHTGIIAVMTANGEDLAATKYAAAHRSEITGDDLEKVGHMIEVASVRGESQRQADAILKATPTMDMAMSRAAQLGNPRVRQETEDRIRRTYEDRAFEARMESAEAFKRARSILERTGDIHNIPPALLLKLSPDDNSSLQHRQDQIRNPKRVTDPAVYTSLMNSASLSAATRQWFSRVDLGQYHDQLSDGDFRHLLNLQRRIREPGLKKETDRDAAVQTLRSMGVELPAVPGAPLRPGTSAPAVSSSGIPGITSQHPALPPLTEKQVNDARKSPAYARYLRNLGYQLP
jgi:hypothetical protein